MAWVCGIVKKSKSSIVGSVLSWLAIALVAAVVIAVAVVPRFIGAVPLTVLTGSMVPTHRPGDIVIVQPTPVENLAIGDVVTFQPVSGDRRLTTHRIVNIATENNRITSVTTRGDANNVDDLPILPEQINGRVVYAVPKVGHLTNPRNAVLAAASLVGGGLVIYAGFELIKLLHFELSSNRKRKT